MAEGDQNREELLTELLVQFEDQLTSGTGGGHFDTSAIAGDDELSAEWEADRECLELLNRVRRRWSPDDARWETPRPVPGALSTFDAEAGTTLGRFRILRELGHGGLGIVYLAYDPQLHRQVALKVPRAESLVSSDLRRRFLREAEAAARLDHPHLVTVHEAGEAGTTCYIAAEFCPGPTLAQWLKGRHEPVPIEVAARMVKQIAEAVQHAHGRGVLHRDIKPSNVLLSRPGAEGWRPAGESEANAKTLEPGGADSSSAFADELCPKLTDFGMAKLLEREGEDTRSGALVGTPAYMAPEQAKGNVRDLDARTDVYALGAILYETLTGRRVFDSNSDVDALRCVLFEEPTAPGRVRAEIPRDLEAICLKCLAKSSDARYRTAQELVDDLGRFLAGQPTEARPLGPASRLSKWARRRPALATLFSVVAAALITLFGVVVAYNSRLSGEVSRAEREAATSRRLLYAADVRVAYETLKANNVVQALDVLNRQRPGPDQEDLREFTWYYLHDQCEPQTVTLVGHDQAVFSVDYAPDGRRLASAGQDGTVRIWDAAIGKSLHVLRGHTSEVTSVAYSPAGNTLATGGEDSTVRLWNPATGDPLKTLAAHEDHVLAVTFAPDGQRLASGGRDMTVRIWDVPNGMLLQTLTGETEVIRAVAFSPGGDLLYAVDEAERLHVWQTVSWQRLQGAKSPLEKFFALAVSHDGTRIAAAGRREAIGIWQPTDAGLQFVQQLGRGHNEWIQSLAFSPTDDTLASAGKDGVLQLWKPGATLPHRTLLGHKDRVWSVAWAPAGRHLASSGGDGSIKIWSLRDGLDYQDAPTPLLAGQHTPNGSQLVTGSYDGTVGLYSTRSHALESAVHAHEREIHSVCVSPDGRRIASHSADSTTKVWLRDTLEELITIGVDSESGSALAWAPDGRRLAMATEPTTITMIDVVSGQIERTFQHKTRVRAAVFTPDGRQLVTTSQSLDLWDASTGQLKFTLPGAHREIAVARDRNLIAAASGSNITLIDLTSAEQITTLATVGADVNCLAIWGGTLAVGIIDPVAVDLWDIRTRQVLARLECDAQKVNSLDFSPDGRRLAAMGADAAGRGRIWEWTIRARPQTPGHR